MVTSEAQKIKKQETIVRFSIISYKTRLSLYLHDENKSVNPWLLYDILRGLKALCGMYILCMTPESEFDLCHTDLHFYLDSN